MITELSSADIVELEKFIQDSSINVALNLPDNIMVRTFLNEKKLIDKKFAGNMLSANGEKFKELQTLEKYIEWEIIDSETKEDIKKLEIEKLKLEVENFRNDFFDYPATKRRTARLEFWTIVSVILAALAILISIIKSK